MKNNQHNKNRGQDLVEFAITLPILAFIIFMILDLGRAAYYYTSLQNAAREGARYAVVNPEDTPGVVNLVKDRAIGVDASDPDFVVGLGSNIGDLTDDWTNEDFVQVQILYTFKLLTPFVGPLFENGRASMEISSTMQREKWEPYP